jgi:hypothetical protein
MCWKYLDVGGRSGRNTGHLRFQTENRCNRQASALLSGPISRHTIRRGVLSILQGQRALRQLRLNVSNIIATG